MNMPPRPYRIPYRIMTHYAFYDFLRRREAGGKHAPSREEYIEAARFLIMLVTAGCTDGADAERDAKQGLALLREIGESVPEFPGSGHRFADKVALWFHITYPPWEYPPGPLGRRRGPLD